LKFLQLCTCEHYWIGIVLQHTHNNFILLRYLSSRLSIFLLNFPWTLYDECKKCVCLLNFNDVFDNWGIHLDHMLACISCILFANAFFSNDILLNKDLPTRSFRLRYTVFWKNLKKMVLTKGYVLSWNHWYIVNPSEGFFLVRIVQLNRSRPVVPQLENEIYREK
jgi:hypothetical protein